MVFTILKYKKTIVNNITVTDKMLVEFIYNQEGKNYAARRKAEEKMENAAYVYDKTSCRRRKVYKLVSLLMRVAVIVAVCFIII